MQCDNVVVVGEVCVIACAVPDKLVRSSVCLHSSSVQETFSCPLVLGHVFVAAFLKARPGRTGVTACIVMQCPRMGGYMHLHSSAALLCGRYVLLLVLHR